MTDITTTTLAPADWPRPDWPQQRSRLKDALEYRDHIEKLGLSQNAASRFLGVSERNSRRYAKLDRKGRPENIPIPAAIDMLLRLMVKHKVSVEAACKLAGSDPEEVWR